LSRRPQPSSLSAPRSRRFFYADTYAKAAKKEERCCDQKEIAESHADSEEILDTTRGRIAGSIRNAFIEKEATSSATEESPSPTPKKKKNDHRRQRHRPAPSPHRKKRSSPSPQPFETPIGVLHLKLQCQRRPLLRQSRHRRLHRRKHGAPNATLSPDQIKGFDNYSPKVQKLLSSALELTTRNLDYKYGSADPSSGGMDCSGFVILSSNKTISAMCRGDSSEQYSWVRRARQLSRS